jgi:hypothetical protein
VVRIPIETRDISSPKRLEGRGLRTFLFYEYRGSFPGVKTPGREGDHSLLSIKNEWSYNPTPLINVRGMDRKIINFYFT